VRTLLVKRNRRVSLAVLVLPLCVPDSLHNSDEQQPSFISQAIEIHNLEFLTLSGVCRGTEVHETSDAATVLLSTSVNQDGRSSSLTAPNGPSQQVASPMIALSRVAISH